MVALPEAAERARPLLCLLHKPASSHLGQVHGSAAAVLHALLFSAGHHGSKH